MIRNRKISGNGFKPPDRDLVDSAKNAYELDGRQIQGYIILHKTPTLTFYKKNNDNTIIIAVRGTKITDVNDLLADASLLVNKLKWTPRYKRDKATVIEMLRKYPNDDFYLSSHSLGGAIADQLLKDLPRINGGLAINPAFQPSAFIEKPRQRRIYNHHDFIGNIGKYLPEAEIAKETKQDEYIPPIAKAILDHNIDSTPDELLGSGFIHRLFGKF